MTKQMYDHAISDQSLTENNAHTSHNRKDHQFNGKLSSIMLCSRLLYLVLKNKADYKTNICKLTDTSLRNITGLSRDSYYYAKKELKKHGIIAYNSRPGSSDQEIQILINISLTEKIINNLDQAGSQKFVYIILYDNYVKIGKTTNIQKRFTTLKGTSHIKPRLLWHTLETPNINEKMLHDKFWEYRTHGEYFEYSDEIKSFVESAKGGVL